MKNILKRIIVGVGIALVLMAIKGNLSLKTYARTVYNPTPVTFYNVKPDNSLQTFNIVQFEPAYIRTTFYGAQYTNNNAMSSYLFWGYGTNTIDVTENLDISFLIYGTFSTSMATPIRVWINDANGNQIACQTQSSITMSSGAISGFSNYITPVMCSNVALTGSAYFRVYVGDHFDLVKNEYYGITKLSIYEHGSNNAVVGAIEDNTQAVDDVNDTLNDDSVDNSKADSDINTMKGKIATNGSISSLITLPISLYQAILNSANASCSTFNLGTLYNHTLTLPCINLENILGSTLFGIIDMLCSGLFILSFRKKMVDIFNHMTSLNDRGNELE